MPTKKLSVVVTRRLPEQVETRLKELFDVTLREDDTPMSREALVAAVAGADVLVPTITDHIDATLLAQAGDRLKLIANYGAGVDHIDVSTARQRGVLVSNTPGVTTDDTADMTLALMLGVTRRLPEGTRKAQSDDWAGWAPTAMLGVRLGGRRLGILGMGRIGQAVASVGELAGIPPSGSLIDDTASGIRIGAAVNAVQNHLTDCKHTAHSFASGLEIQRLCQAAPLRPTTGRWLIGQPVIRKLRQPRIVQRTRAQGIR